VIGANTVATKVESVGMKRSNLNYLRFNKKSKIQVTIIAIYFMLVAICVLRVNGTSLEASATDVKDERLF
jgi:hypothetical protein